MATGNPVEPLSGPNLWGRRVGIRFVVGVAALVLAGFAAFGILPVLYALAGFAAIAAAALLATERGAGGSVLAVDDPPARSPEQLIDAVVAGMPDAAIVIGREGRVVAFNAAARMIAPALARDAPASLALRVPEIVEAVNRHVGRYVADTGYGLFPYGFEEFLIKRYRPAAQDQFPPHVDVTNANTMHRMLALVLYLNNVAEGGETAFTKLDVKGANQHPLYSILSDFPDDAGKAGNVTWNFEKFLVDKDGQVVRRFRPKVVPEDPQIIQAIESLL